MNVAKLNHGTILRQPVREPHERAFVFNLNALNYLNVGQRQGRTKLAPADVPLGIHANAADRAAGGIVSALAGECFEHRVILAKETA